MLAFLCIVWFTVTLAGGNSSSTVPVGSAKEWGEGVVGSCDGCSGRVQWEGAVGGCSGRVQWEGAAGGCSGRVLTGSV